MSDKIKVSTDHLDQLASQLRSLGGKLGSASSSLRGIYMDSATADHMLRDGSCRLSGNAGMYRVSLGTTHSTVRRYSNALDEYDDLCRKLAKEVNMVKEHFVALEAKISAMVNEDTDEIGRILKLPRDTSQWSNNDWNQYLAFVNGYVNYDIPGGGNLYVRDGHFIYVGPNGHTAEYDFGDFLFFNHPFRPGFGEHTGRHDPIRDMLDRAATILIPFEPPIMSFVYAGTPGEGLLSWVEDHGGDYGSKIKLAKGKDESGQTGLLNKKGKDGKNEKTDSVKKTYKDGQWVDSEDGVKKPDHTFVEIGAKKEGEVGWIMDEVGVQGENGHASAKGAIGYAEGEMGAYGGLYAYDENGKAVLAPGVRAEIGGSASILHGEADAGYDFGPLEVGASGSVDAGKVAGKLEGQLGWAEGKFAASAGFEAEALAFEAKGSVNAGNEYVDVKATGGVQVGIGASGDIGYNDGVVSVELSVAVGLGLSGKVELDVGGAIDAASDAAVSAAEGIADAYDGAMKGMKKLSKLIRG